ncbi:MAG: hypothetical protein KAR35_10965, partial [Candidatus Heimdallarchaeota archaeon]|nr:hypothetical protein [Candidatus Heimdallarchaeota archaeon]
YDKMVISCRESLNMKKGTNILLLETQALEKVGSEFLNQLEDFLNHLFDPLTSFNTSLFFFSKNRFLHLKKEAPISKKERFKRLFTKNYWKRTTYGRNVSKYSIDFGFYLAFLSNFLNSDIHSIHLYLSHLNQTNDNETGVFVTLNTLFTEYLAQLKEDNHISEKDEIPEFTAFAGHNLDITEKEMIDESKSLGLIGELAKEKPKKLVKTVNRSDKAKMMGNTDLSNIESEELLLAWKGSLKLRHRTYRSNLSTRGSFILTTKRLIISKRKFGFLSFIPMIAYVRPNNRAMIVIMKIISFLNRFRKVITGIIKGIGPGAIVAFAFSFPFLSGFFNFLSNIFPTVNVPFSSPISDFAAENPQGFAAILGVLGGFSVLIVQILRIALFRSKSITVIPLSLFTDLVSSTRRGSQLQMIWKPMGTSKLHKISEGLPFHFRTNPREVKGIPKETLIQRINLTLAGILASRETT